MTTMTTRDAVTCPLGPNPPSEPPRITGATRLPLEIEKLGSGRFQFTETDRAANRTERIILEDCRDSAVAITATI